MTKAADTAICGDMMTTLGMSKYAATVSSRITAKITTRRVFLFSNEHLVM